MWTHTHPLSFDMVYKPHFVKIQVWIHQTIFQNRACSLSFKLIWRTLISCMSDNQWLRPTKWCMCLPQVIKHLWRHCFIPLNNLILCRWSVIVQIAVMVYLNYIFLSLFRKLWWHVVTVILVTISVSALWTLFLGFPAFLLDLYSFEILGLANGNLSVVVELLLFLVCRHLVFDITFLF